MKTANCNWKKAAAKRMLHGCIWLTILVIALSGCTKTDDPTVDNGDNPPANPTNPTNTGDTTTVYKSDFTKKTFSSPEEIQAFIPKGIYEIDYLLKHLEAFGTDGSYTSTYLYDTPKASVYLNKGADMYNVLYESDRGCWVRQDYHDVPTGGAYENIEYFAMSDATGLLTLFITGDNCEKAPTRVSDDKVAGVDVKHYVFETTDGIYITDNEYWVTSAGLCLKYQLSSGTKDNPTTIYTGSVTWLTFDVGDFKDVLNKMPLLVNAPSAIPAFDGLYTMTYKKYDNEWLSDQYPRSLDKWIIPYTAAGPIISMEVWHDPGQSVYEGWTNIYLTVTVTNHQDILDYISSVMKIQGMSQTSFLDQETNGMRIFDFESDNSSIVVKSGDNYIAYSITSYLDTYYIHIRLWTLTFV